MTHTVPAPFQTAAELLLARRAAQLSQGALAALAGMDASSISRLEHSNAPIPRSTGYHLALVMAWIGQHASSSAPVAAAKRVGRPSNETHVFTNLDGSRIAGLDVEAMPPGFQYRRMTFRQNRPTATDTYTRGAGSRFDDKPDAT